MKRIAEAFEYIFSEDDWFNTVLVGGFYVILSPIGFGLVMVMGFQVELTRRIARGETGFPFWRNPKVLFLQGLRSFLISLWYAGLIVVLLALAGIPTASWATLSVLIVFHFLFNPVIIRTFSAADSVLHCMNPAAILRSVGKSFFPYIRLVTVTTVMIVIASLLGWMWIVGGWPLLIFLMMIVQTVSFAKL